MAVMNRDGLLRSLKGQRMHIPCFDNIFQNWPIRFNPKMQQLREDVDDRMHNIVDHQFTRRSERALAMKKLQAPNPALRGAYWWPTVDDKTLHTLTFLSLWTAMWDDMFDPTAEFLNGGALASDFEAAQNYRYQTLLYIRQCLQLPTGSYQATPNDVVITSFEDVAFHVNAVCNTEQKERFYIEIEQHVLATAERQRKRSCPDVPALGSYLQTRIQASGVGLCQTLLAIIEQREVPNEIKNDPNMQKLLDQVNIMVLVTSDILQLKCKVARGNVDNLVALLWMSTPDIDSAVSVALSILEAAKQDFDETARQLVAEHLEDGLPNADLESFIGACRATCAGNLVWSISACKYDVHECECDKPARHTVIL